MKMSRGSRLLATLTCAGLVFAACGGDDDDTADSTATTQAAATETTAEATTETTAEATTETTAEATTETTAEATTETTMADTSACDATVPGTQVNYGIFAPNSAFDPVGSSGALVGGTEIAAVYDVLFRFDPTTLEVTPHLAESLTPDNADFTEWTLKLREGITFSDGTPLDAQLVSDNIDRYFAAEGVRNTSGGFLQYIDTRDVVDATTLHMTLNTSFAEFGLVFADEPGMIVNLNAIGDDIDAFRVQPPDAAGVGPYVVERNVPGEETVLKARADYWGGPVCIETLRFVWVPGSAGTYDAFSNGDMNVAFLRDPIVNQKAIDDGAQTFFVDQDGGAMLNFNRREGRITADPRVRQAISLALDPAVINDRAYQGKLETTKAYFGPRSPYFSDAIEELPVDTAAAMALVDEVKAEGWDGTLGLIAGNSGTGPDTALAIEGMLGAIGIQAQTELMATGDSIGRLVAGDFDVITNGFNSGPGTAVLSLVRNLSSTSPSNRMAVSNPNLDALLAEALATPFADLPPVMAKINNEINADSTAINYAVTSEGIVWADNISGIVPTVSTIFLFHDAFIDG
jgi:peptide/nickel transport system substrate-binding protein